MLNHVHWGYSPCFLSLLTFIYIYFWPFSLFSFHAWTKITSFFPQCLIIIFSSHPSVCFFFHLFIQIGLLCFHATTYCVLLSSYPGYFQHPSLVLFLLIFSTTHSLKPHSCFWKMVYSSLWLSCIFFYW